MSDAPMSNAMKLQKVSIRLLALSFMLLITSPAMTCMAQRNAARKIDKELFDKKRRGRAFDDKIKDRGAAGKAIEEQKKKESERKKDGEKTLKELKDRHFRMQSVATQERMKANRERTEIKYKAKKQKQRKEQKRPKQYRT
ncbi:MAG: hypothetical protein MUP53_01865 [Bacteroidales bacterium]|nr:hypothetical protein [Bacteroidales bacterium]